MGNREEIARLGIPWEDVWHIRDREKKSKRDAVYIHALLTYFSLEFGDEYRKILDVACGTGRFHGYLRDLGYSVDGFDINGEFVEKARERNPGGNYWVGDMREERGNGEYDAVLNWFTSFGYFDPPTNRKVLDNMVSFLRPGGLLLLDLPVPQGGRRYWMEREWGYELVDMVVEEKEGHRFLVFNEYYLVNGQVRGPFPIRVQLFDPREIRSLLEGMGMEVHIFDGYSLRPFSGAPRMTVVGRKGGR